MRDFHIFWTQYGMDHYLFLHLIAFIIQKYSAFNDNKALLRRRPNTIYIIASWCYSAQLLSTAFLCAILPPWQRGMLWPGEQQLTKSPFGQETRALWFPEAQARAPQNWEIFSVSLASIFPGFPVPSLWQPAHGGCFCSSWG